MHYILGKNNSQAFQYMLELPWTSDVAIPTILSNTTSLSFGKNLSHFLLLVSSPTTASEGLMAA